MKKIFSHIVFHLKNYFRDPAYIFTSIMLPAGLYWFFAVPESTTDYIGSFMICSFSAFSFFGIVFFQHSVHTAIEKEKHWYQFQQLLPFRSFHTLMARYIVSVVVGFFACGLIYLIGINQTPSKMSALLFSEILAVLVLASLPFSLFGYWVGQNFSTKSILPVGNFLYLFFSFAGGLWKPPELLPKTLQDLCKYWPTYHYGNLAWYFVVPGAKWPSESVTHLIGFAIVMIVLISIKPGVVLRRFKIKRLFESR